MFWKLPLSIIIQNIWFAQALQTELLLLNAAGNHHWPPLRDSNVGWTSSVSGGDLNGGLKSSVPVGDPNGGCESSVLPLIMITADNLRLGVQGSVTFGGIQPVTTLKRLAGGTALPAGSIRQQHSYLGKNKRCAFL